jgi:FkbM family methyltransferase
MTLFKRQMRALLRRPARMLLPLGARIGTLMLANSPTRKMLNAAYEHLGPVVAGMVTRVFSDSRIKAPFIWKARFRAGVLMVPVLPELHRSWNNALAWRWPPNLPVRIVYEEYIDYQLANRRRAKSKERYLLLDVGANDGTHSCFFACAGWDCVAFEPQPSCIAYLRRISELNGFDQIVAEQCVVGEQEATDIPFYTSDSTWFSSLDRESVERFEHAETQHVDMITLDAYCETRGLRPSCIKIDVEGRELSVILGAERLLETTLPDLFIEVSADAQGRTALWDRLASLGYHVFVLGTNRRRVLRAVDGRAEFVAAGGGRDQIDALFTADAGLRAHLEATLAAAA